MGINWSLIFNDFEKKYTKEEIIEHSVYASRIRRFRRPDIESFLNTYYPEVVEATWEGTTRKLEGRGRAPGALLRQARKRGYVRKVDALGVYYQQKIIL